MTQLELACLSKRVSLLHKQIQDMFCSFWLNKFFDLLAGLARFMRVSLVSTLSFNHVIAHPRKPDMFYFFTEAPYNQNKVCNKHGVFTWETGWPIKWPGYTCRQNEKNLTHLLNQPWLKGQSVQYNQPLSYIGIFEITFSEIQSMRRYFLLCFRTAAYN